MAFRLGSLGACAVVLAGCAGGPEAGGTGPSLSQRLLSPDRSRRSSFEQKVFDSRQVETSTYEAGRSSLPKAFGGSKKFAAGEFSPGPNGAADHLSRQRSPLAGRTAETFSSRHQDEVAHTHAFAGGERRARTHQARQSGQGYAAGENRVAELAQENAIEGSDLVIGEVAGGAPGGAGEDGRLLSVPLDLRPDGSSPVGSRARGLRTVEDVRRLLNKGYR